MRESIYAMAITARLSAQKALWTLVRYVSLGISSLVVCILALTVALNMGEVNGPFEGGAMSLLSLIAMVTLVIAPFAGTFGVVLAVLTLLGYDEATDVMDRIVAKAVGWAVEPKWFWIGCVVLAGVALIGVGGWR